MELPSSVNSQSRLSGVDIVSKDYSYNWDYTQSAFFSLTILTTIGKVRQGPTYKLEKYLSKSLALTSDRVNNVGKVVRKFPVTAPRSAILQFMT